MTRPAELFGGISWAENQRELEFAVAAGDVPAEPAVAGGSGESEGGNDNCGSRPTMQTGQRKRQAMAMARPRARLLLLRPGVLLRGKG